MLNKTKVKLIFLIAIITALLSCGVTFAWFSGASEIDTAAVQGSVLRNYFERGNGTKDNPFIIHNPRHLYNLAWLQYMGKFNETNDDGSLKKQFYFELCDGDGCVLDDKNGITELDMTGWVLPPIGTSEYPFVGNFNGNGITISNLTVSGNMDDLSNVALDNDEFLDGAYDSSNAGCDIVGLFGVIGNAKGAAGAIGSTANAYDVSQNIVQDVYLDNVTVKADTGTSLIGILAGYVNGTVSGAGIVNSTVVATSSALSSSAITSNVSDYATVGYCTEAYEGQIESVKISIAAPTLSVKIHTSSGAGVSWGGSIPIKDLFSRLDTMRNSAERIKYYKTIVEQRITSEADSTETVVPISSKNEVITDYAKYETASGGSVAYYYHTGSIISDNYGTPGSTYILAYGGDTIATYSATTTYYVSTTSGGFAISTNQSTSEDQNYKMCIELTSSGVYLIGSTTSPAYASSWNFEQQSGEQSSSASSGYLVTKVSGSDVYLNCSMSSSPTLSISTTANTTWYYGDNSIYCVNTSTSTKYYLSFDQSTLQWILATEANDVHYITDETKQHYFTVNESNNGVEDKTSTGSATKWVLRTPFSSSSKLLFYSRSNASDSYYLNQNNSSFEFVKNNMQNSSGDDWTLQCDTLGSSKYTISYYNWYYGTYYLTYDDDGSWKLSQLRNILLKSGSYYMVANSNGNITATTSKAEATRWAYNSYTQKYSTVIGGTTYYLDTTKSSSKYYYCVDSSGCKWSDDTQIRCLDNNSVYLYHGEYESGKFRIKLITSETSRVSQEIDSSVTAPYVYYIPVNSVAHASIIKFEFDSSVPHNEFVRKSTYDVDVKTPDTYIPLAVEDGNSDVASMSNTGYIVGGVRYSTSQQTKWGDLRLSAQSMTGLYHSLDYSDEEDASFDKSRLQILTRTYYSNGLARIIDDDNKNHSLSNNYYSDCSTIAGISLQKYANAKEELITSFAIDSYTTLYGLHFMNTLIDQNYLITASAVRINESEYTDYQLPQDCIDCNLRYSGYITFFAGTYYSGSFGGSDNNDSFFSLYQIFRGGTDGTTILDIKHISKVYDDPTDSDKPYCYEYDDDGVITYSTGGGVLSSKPSEYTREVFDCTWIEEPYERGVISTTVKKDNTLFYYEIPVNKGEYALGSVYGRNGAYLLYLDISARAVSSRVEKATEMYTIKGEGYTYPKGVQLVSTTQSAVIDDVNSVGVAVTGNTRLNIIRSGNVVTASAVNSNIRASYIHNLITMYDSSGTALSASSVATVTTEVAVKRITENEYIPLYVGSTDYKLSRTTVTEYTVEKYGGNVVSSTASAVITENGTQTAIKVDAVGSLESFDSAFECVYFSNTGAYTTTISSVISPVSSDDYTTYNVIDSSSGETELNSDDVWDYVNQYSISIDNTSDINVVTTKKHNRFTGTINGNTVSLGSTIPLN